jgi:hypothetical protein
MLAVQDDGAAVVSDTKESAAVNEENKDVQPQQVYTTKYDIHPHMWYHMYNHNRNSCVLVHLTIWNKSSVAELQLPSNKFVSFLYKRCANECSVADTDSHKLMSAPTPLLMTYYIIPQQALAVLEDDTNTAVAGDTSECITINEKKDVQPQQVYIVYRDSPYLHAYSVQQRVNTYQVVLVQVHELRLQA